VEMLIPRVFILVLVASIARTVASEERQRQADVGALQEELSVSEERRRLARDLHDGIGHVLTRVILSLELARRQCAVEPAAAAQTVGQQADALRGAMEEMRQIVATLRTEPSSYDFQTAVRAMAAELGETGSLEVELQLPEKPLPLAPHSQYHLSRVVQEALTNCMRHSGSRHAEVHVQVMETPVGRPRVTAVVRDEGKGFELDRVNDAYSHGLRGMEERLAPYGGKVMVDSTPGHGTRVTAELPGEVEGW